MTSNNLISGYSAIQAFNNYVGDHWARQLTVVEYSRHGRVYTSVSGRIMDKVAPSYIGSIYLLQTKLHVGSTIALDGFPAQHEMRRVSLECWYDDAISFEVVAAGSIGILHGFTRDGWLVDVFVHASR